MKIGTMIKKQRMEMGLTQEMLAEQLNVTPQAVSRWENELSYPDTPLLPRISHVLQLSCDELLLGKTEETDLLGEKQDTKIVMHNQNVTQSLLQNDIDMVFGFSAASEKKECRHILIADDSDFLRMMVRQILLAEQYTVLEAKDGKECMDILAKETVDSLILDIHMPVMDGFEVLEKVRECYSKLPVIMLTADCAEESVRRALNLGAKGYVVKPFGADVLLEHLRNL